METESLTTARCVRCGTVHPTEDMVSVGSLGWACDHPAEHPATSGVTCAMQLLHRGYGSN